MSSIAISGDTSGTVSLAAPAVAGTNTITLPAGTGTMAVQGASTNIVSGTLQSATSGIAITFTGIPSWIKRITMQVVGITPSGSASNFVIRIGSGSIVSTGYAATSSGGVTTLNSNASTVGFPISPQTYASTALISGQMILTLVNSATNLWVASGFFHNTSSTAFSLSNGNLALSGALDRIQIATANGTDTFTAGSVNILYE